ncbi:helix-turn-helix domain-containing protein [Pseudomonas sp. NPDC090203]|uniref:helix-turn-helix domain-containing protein n=1 Tax=Pseudomonas sp. NPDC090203 TaxID=3364477 RepID=UPI0037F697F5
MSIAKAAASIGIDFARLSPEQLIVLDRYLRRLQPGGDAARLSAWQERAAKKMMMDNLDGGIQISDVARECSLSRSHFSRAFKNSTGQTPRDWLQLARLTQAKELLEQTDLSISQVGLECGFADQPHFTRMFTRRFGMTPGRLRTEQRGVTAG